MLINLMFFITRITKLFILKKMGKSMNLANSATVVDGTMFTIGWLAFAWATTFRGCIKRALLAAKAEDFVWEPFKTELD